MRHQLESVNRQLVGLGKGLTSIDDAMQVAILDHLESIGLDDLNLKTKES